MDSDLTRSHPGTPRAVKAWPLSVVALLIAYGSLYPFDLTLPSLPATAWRDFLSSARMPSSLGDILGNAALFVPFGVAAMVSFPSWIVFRRAFLTLTAALILAVTLQALQLYLPSRTPALGDVVWNMIGTLAGVLVGAAIHDRAGRVASLFVSLPVGVVLLWFAAELIPFVPSLDWQEIKESLKPIMRGELHLATAVLHAAGVLLAGEAMGRIFNPRQAWSALILASVGIVAAKVIVVTQRVDISLIFGLAVGFAAWLVVRRWPSSRRIGVVAIALMGAYAIAALAPFEIAPAPNSFNLMPFAGLLQGSMLVNTQALLVGALVFVGVAWLARIGGGSARAASIGVAGIVLLLEFAQIYVRGRSPDVTEPILAVILGFAVGAWPEPFNRTPSPVVPIAPGSVEPRSRDQASAFASWPAWTLRVAIACAVIALPIAIVLRLPGVPYNVAELFLASGAFPVLMIFAFALLWTGAAPVVISAWILGRERRDWQLPICAFVAGLISLALLALSATPESIEDIAGSRNLFWFVTNKDIWGSWARQLFLALDSPGAIGFLERCVRYSALYGPLVTFPAVMFVFLESRRMRTISPRRIAIWVATGTLWLWLCKAIAFDWSSTDNLNELITRDGEYGLGGGGYLYLLVALISANIVGLARIPPRASAALIGIAVTVILVPLGWWLVTHGLEPRVEKYGHIFSGVQFLLGPDRSRVLGDDALFLRWSGVQLGAVIVAVVGARLARAAPVVGLALRRRERPLPGISHASDASSHSAPV